jgi:hypothetical protein
MTYRNDMEALAARKERLEVEVKAKTKELDTTGRLLDQMKAKAKLPVLPNIRVASPCTADWNAMTPADADADRVRHCGSCQKNVYNLSQMTRDEAEALILAKEGRLCVRYFQRKDGTILLKDCTVGVTSKRKRRLIAAGAAMLLAGGGSAAYAITRDGDGNEHRYETTAGVMAVDTPVEVQGGIGPDEVHELKGQIASPDVEMKMGGVANHNAFDDVEQVKPKKLHHAKPHAKKPAK